MEQWNIVDVTVDCYNAKNTKISPSKAGTISLLCGHLCQIEVILFFLFVGLVEFLYFALDTGTL